MGQEPLPPEMELAAKAIVDSVLSVHRTLGPGLTGLRLGLLINFTVPMIKLGIKSLIL